MAPGTVLTALDGLAYGLALFIAAAGLSLTLGVAGTVNLAHGALYLTGAYLAYAFTDRSFASLVVAIGAGIAVGAALGLLLHTLLRALTHLEQALASVGAALLIATALTQVFGGEPHTVDPPTLLAGSVHLLGRAYPIYRLLFIAAGTILALALWWFVRRTRPGAILRATAADPQAVSTLGIEPRRVHAAALTAGACLATTAGVIAAPVIGPAPGTDHIVLLLCLAIVIAGGAGSIPGVLVAALAVGQIQTTAVIAWPAAAPYLVFAVLAAGLVIQTVHRRRRIRPPPAPTPPP